MKFSKNLSGKQNDKKLQTTSKEKQQKPITKKESKSDDKSGFKHTKSTEDWMRFMANLTVKLAEQKTPELILCFRGVSMAENMLKYCPNEVHSILTNKPILIEFPDGKGAIRVEMKNISNLNKLVELLFQGPFDEDLYLINGIVSGLPIAAQSAFLGTIGVSKGTNIEDILVW